MAITRSIVINGPKVTSPTKSVVSAAPVPAPKRDYKAIKAFAEQMSGYNSSSPIWGKRVPEVLNMIESHVIGGDSKGAVDLIQEFRSRIAYNQLISAQR